MPEKPLDEYLRDIDHAIEEMREPKSSERDKEIDEIQKRVRSYIQGLERVDTKQMKLCILAGLDELAPRIEALVKSTPNK